jgi:4-hydroxy-tetrahydrodipicolinate synthase
MGSEIGGAIAAAITPRLSIGVGVDSAAAIDLADFLESCGIDGITLLGSTGEFPHFDLEDRSRFVALISKRSRVPILANVSHSTLDGAVALANAAADAGVAGVLVMPPYYFRYNTEALRAFFLAFAEQVKCPAYLYNIPQFTSEIPMTLAIELLTAESFAGIKDSSGSWENFEALQRSAADCGFSVFVGSERICSRACAKGAAGTISGMASVLPELVVAIDRLARNGQSTTALDRLAAEFSDRTAGFPFPAGIREALAVRGFKTGPHAVPINLADVAAFREWFQGWLPGALVHCARSPNSR